MATCHRLHEMDLEEDRGATLHYVVLDTDDELVALASVQSTAPLAYEGILRGNIRVEAAGGTVWMAEVPYIITHPTTADSSAGNNPGGGTGGSEEGGVDPNSSLPEDYSFSTSDGTTHILRSKLTIAAYAAGDPPTYPLGSLDQTAATLNNCPNYHHLINVTDDSIDGVDIIAPQSSFTIKRKFTTVTNGWFVNMNNLTGKLNNAGWRGFRSRELLFCGCDGNKAGAEKWDLTFKFKFQPSEGFARFGFTVTDPTETADMIPIAEDAPELYLPEKVGWDYMWVRRTLVPITVDGVVRKIERPMYVYVESVYDTGDFSILGLDL